MDTENLSQERQELKAKYGDEAIFVIRNDNLPPIDPWFQKADFEVTKEIANMMYPMPRWMVEKNPDYRQPIPYIVVMKGEDVFGMVRLKGAGEARLHGLLAIGVGGHIDKIDEAFTIDGLEIISRAIIRELKEEIGIKGSDYTSCVLEGYINDLSNEVGQDHLGLVYVLKLKDDVEVKVVETDKYEGRFYTQRELHDTPMVEMEEWTKIILIQDFFQSKILK